MSPQIPNDAVVNARLRQSKPERIHLNDDELVRQDLIAVETGLSERSINRGDKDGAPFTYVGNVKYRPDKAYKQFLASRIQTKNQSPVRRRRAGRAR